MTRSIYNDERSKRQSSVFVTYSITNRAANQRGLAQWYERSRNGVWDRQNYEDNFGKETKGVS